MNRFDRARDKLSNESIGGPAEDQVLAEKIAADIHDIWRRSKPTIPSLKVGEIGREQYWILRFLYENGPQRIKDIALELGTTSSPVTISVKRMAQKNLVKRERSARDERVVRVQLTSRGKSVFELWRRERRKALSALFKSFSQAEKRTLLGLLEKVVATSQG